MIINICHNVRFAHSSVCAIGDNADIVTESPKLGTKVFMWQDSHSSVGRNCTKNYGL